MLIDKVEKLQLDLNEALSELDNVVNSNDLSKGMKVNKIRDEIKANLSLVNKAMDNLVKNEKLRREIDGVTYISMLGSKNNIRYQLSGKEDLLLIKQVKLADDTPAFHVHYRNASGIEMDEFIGLTLEDCFVKALTKLYEHEAVTKEELVKLYPNSVILNRVFSKV